MRPIWHVLKFACVVLLLFSPRRHLAKDQLAYDKNADLHLIRRLYSSLKLVQEGKETWRLVLSQLYHGNTFEQKSLRGRPDAIYQLLGALGGTRQSSLGLCKKDPTLPSSIPYERILIASNLRQNAAVLPHYILQILVATAILPAGSTFVSIYESGSSDASAEWLMLLDEFLARIDVPRKIVTGLNGGIKRKEGQERIEFLSRIRDLAVSVIQPGSGEKPREWEAERVLFINDVFFCAKDIIRLLQHTNVALACSMDFNFMPAWHPHMLQFYDKWVMREVDGAVPLNGPPYVTSIYSAERLHQGWTFPVSCCWNGMASFSAQPFMEGLHFRTYKGDECRECEASNMCTDFWELGLTDMIVDSGVRVAYEPSIAKWLRDIDRVPIPWLSWAEISKAPPINLDFAPRSFRRACCNKELHTDYVDLPNCTVDPTVARVYHRQPAAQMH